jgi:hypothetical protein
MLNRSKMFSSDSKRTKDNPDSLDDASAATPPWGSKARRNDSEMTSKVLKFRFVVSTSSNRQVVAPSVVHTHWMQAVQESMDDADIIIYNNCNKPVAKVDLIQWSNPLIHKRQFNMHQKTTGRDAHRKTTYYILHRILTTTSINHIKSIPEVQRILRDHQCFLTEHQWTEGEWDTTQIGFVTGIDPSFHNASQAQVKFNTELRKRAEVTNANPKRIKIPQFRMMFSSIRADTQTGQKVTTKAYSLEVRTEDSLLMMQTLKSYLKDSALFVPYNMRRKFPEGFAKAIRFQTKQLTSNMTVVLENISEDMMFYLKPHFQNIKGVKDILPAFDVEVTGKQRLLVEKDEFTRIRAAIMKSLPVWCDNNNISEDAQPLPGQFPGPARVRPIYNDGMSSGENSWMSASNASFMSMDFSTAQDDDYFTTSSKINHTFSYAEILQPTSPVKYAYQYPTSSTLNTQPEEEGKEVISEITTGRSDIENAQKAEIERLKQLHEEERDISRRIIKEQTLEIQRLKDTQSQEARTNKEATEALRQKNQSQDEATNKLRMDAEQTTLELQQMRLELQSMMNTIRLAIPTNSLALTTTTSSKRTSKNAQEADPRQDKRLNNQSTPAKKKLVFDDEVDQQDHTPHDSAMEAEDANESF